MNLDVRCLRSEVEEVGITCGAKVWDVAVGSLWESVEHCSDSGHGTRNQVSVSWQLFLWFEYGMAWGGCLFHGSSNSVFVL